MRKASTLGYALPFNRRHSICLSSFKYQKSTDLHRSFAGDRETWRLVEVAHSTADLLILGIAGRLPKRSSRLVLESDQRRHPAHAAAAQVLLPGPRQRNPDALPPMPFPNSEPVHISSPPVPAGNQSTDNLLAALSNQKGGRGISNQALDIIEAIGGPRMLTPPLGPKPQDRSRILGSAPAYRDFRASQAASIDQAPGICSGGA